MESYKGTREAFAHAVTSLRACDANVAFISPDSLKAMRATAFAEKYPQSYIETGIAEQCAVDVAAGLASCGMVPFVATYAGFLTMRACEQMRTFVAYPNLNVKFVGINAGLIGGEREGVTHQFYEDVGILSSIPNFKIFLPADAGQAYSAIKLAYETPGPVYIRIGSGREDEFYDRETAFNPDGMTVVKDYGRDAVIFCSGFLMRRAADAVELLKKHGVKATLVDINIIDYAAAVNEDIVSLLSSTEHAFTVEDHNVNGGTGSYISRIACENVPVSVTRIGLSTFGESGAASEVADHYGFSAEAIAEKIINRVKK